MFKFWVPGIPQPGGSKRAFIVPGTRRVVVTEANTKSKPWRTAVAWAAKEVIVEPLRGPLAVYFDFSFSRPKGHFGSGKNQDTLKPGAPLYPTVRPDTTKLVRSTEDALKGIAWVDDSQIVIQWATKNYGTPGCSIKIIALELVQSIQSQNGDRNGRQDHKIAAGETDQ